jgi:iron-sulfur cluster repair protein YtfE (RIC family)
MKSEPPGEHLVRELLWVHGMLRRDLEIVRELVDQVNGGAPAAQVSETIAGLQTHGALWHIKVNCLHYCRFVHGHHGLEDAMIFPRIRESDPDENATVDRLEADHRRIAELLDEVENATATLEDDRPRLVAALESLGEHLLEHLAFEEEKISPVIRRWETWAG